jgi:hypothetical protein
MQMFLCLLGFGQRSRAHMFGACMDTPESPKVARGTLSLSYEKVGLPCRYTDLSPAISRSVATAVACAPDIAQSIWEARL